MSSTSPVSDIWQTSAHSIDNTPVIGIDLGTSNSCASIWHPYKNRAKIIKLSKQRRIIPSTVTYQSSSEDVIIGNPPDDMYVVCGFKRYMGLTGSDLTANYSNTFLPNEVTTDHEDRVLLRCQPKGGGPERGVRPSTLSSLVLSHIRDEAEEYLRRKPIPGMSLSDGTHIVRCVLGVPASFSNAQRNATRLAAEEAGFTDIHLLIESTAAALGYGLLCAGDKRILVFDMGGGTTDATVMGVVNGGQCEVTAAAGHSQCGGRDIDILLLSHLLGALLRYLDSTEKTVKTSGSDMDGEMTKMDDQDVETIRRALLEMCRKCKEVLSDTSSYEICVPPSFLKSRLLRRVSECLTTSSFLAGDDLTWRENYSCSSSGDGDVAGDSEPGDEDTDVLPTTALLTARPACELTQGASTSGVDSFVDGVVVQVSRAAFTEIVAPVLQEVKGVMGTAIDMHRMRCKDSSASIDEVVLVGGSSLIPSVRDAVYSTLQSKAIEPFSTGERELCCSVNPHECVAQGLAVKGALLMGVGADVLQDVLMIDALPTAVGIVVESNDTGGEKYFEPVLERGSPIPCSNTKLFRVASSDQKKVSLLVYEEIIDGDREARMVLMGSYDVGIAGCTRWSDDDEWYVKINFSMDEDAVLKFQVEEPPKGNLENQRGAIGFPLLMVYTIFLLSLYIAIKIYIPNNSYSLESNNPDSSKECSGNCESEIYDAAHSTFQNIDEHEF
mmetsp:Transcript_745/g.1237  ORF Transcript_745/g.1237 Transcript_745/m.1237 type:complete len:723 (-) Transcript_745:28-2196(-)